MASMSLLKQFLDAENRRDWNLWGSLLHPEVQYQIIGEQEVVRGKEHYVRRMQQAYTALPDWQFYPLHIYGDEQTILVEFDGAGHFVGEHRGRQYEGVPLHLTSVCIFEFRDGLISTVREYLDQAGYERQLSVADT